MSQLAPSQLESSTSLDHGLHPFYEELAQFESTSQLEASSLYARLESEIERVLELVAWENRTEVPEQVGSTLRATAWNIERGTQMEGILKVLGEHPRISQSDLLLLTELDVGMARTGNRNVAEVIAQELDLNYAFAPCYIALNKGSGLEAAVDGENTQALHGNALFSRYPLLEAHSLPLTNGKDMMEGKEKRLGCQRAVISTLDHPQGRLRAVSLHLDAHSSQKHRWYQMKLVLDHLEELEPSLPVLIGGDWNTSTYNSSRAAYSILGYCRRVLMGVDNFINNHCPYPDRWFERHLFRGLEKRGYRYRDLNEEGVCTLHYEVKDLAANERMADWIPNWCFWFINWALARAGDRCSIKLDWFAGKDILPDPGNPPRVLAEVHGADSFLSDHDPIVLDFSLASPGR